MGSVIFCKTRYQDIGYASYNDFWNMVKWAGYPVVYVDELDPQSDNTYIVTPLNDEWLQGWQSPKARIIHYELEWRWDWRASVNEPPGVAEVWCADAWLAKSIGARYVPMGGDERLNEALLISIPYLDMHYVSLLAYQTYRRQIITQQLKDLGIGISVLDNSWGEDRSRRLRQSRAMVHVHQNDNTPGIAPLRWCLAAAHGLPLISETVNDYGIFTMGRMVVSSYEYIARATSSVLSERNRPLLEGCATALHELLCKEYTFKQGIESHV